MQDRRVKAKRLETGEGGKQGGGEWSRNVFKLVSKLVSEVVEREREQAG